ncbi:hypothetical protein DL93DRAFT_2132971 [Clavulina sp. PMI_390]|nr:hypothetical protein DL93DRAFT_2132971 [Clavulina sp. PMI_390]
MSAPPPAVNLKPDSAAATTTPKTPSVTPVSLLEHLHEILLPLTTLPATPAELRDDLQTYVKPQLSDSAPEIPYDLLLRTSRWSNTAGAKLALKDASLDPGDFMMISLLAGSVTSPKAVLGAYTPPPTALEVRRAAVKDRRAVIALINAIFSIVGVAVAAWKASSTAGWTPATRIGCAIASGVIVAIAEGGLYYIWSTRYSASRRPVQVSSKAQPPIVSLTIPQATDIDTAPGPSPASDGPLSEETSLRRRQATGGGGGPSET